MQDNLPLVTIVTPSYNQGQFIEATIKSVLSQTYKNIQYIVVDGASSDATMEVVNRYKDNIDIIIHEKDGGQTDAINKGFKLAKGELVGWINSDDILYPDCVEKIVELYLSHPDGAIFYSSHNDRIDAAGAKIETYQRIIPGKKHILNTDYAIIQQASFYRTDLVKRVNYLDPSIHYCMDLDLFLRLLDHGAIYAYNKKALSGFRMWGGTKTTNGKQLFRREIRNILIKNGGKRLSTNIRRAYWYDLKGYASQVLKALHVR